MEDKTVIWIAAGSFFAGQCFQAYHQNKQEKKLKKQIEILTLEKRLAIWVIKEGRKMDSLDEMVKEFKERQEFINIAKRLM